MIRGRETLAKICLALFFVFVIFYVTIIVRCPSLAYSVRLVPLRSFLAILNGTGTAKGIFLNVALFIPLGWIVAALTKRKSNISFVLPIIFSIVIELIQYYSCRGIADIDDVISNGLGGAIGIGLHRLCSRTNRVRWKQVLMHELSILFLIVGIIEVYATYQSPRLESRLREYDFAIFDVQWENNSITISGTCRVYNKDTPRYLIVLSDDNGNKTKLVTEINDNSFIATGDVKSSTKYTVLIKFTGHETMITGTYIRNNDVEYISGRLPEISGTPKSAVLKAFDQKTDTLIYQDGDRLLWLIGSNVGSTTEIIYHIYTDEPEGLPEKRVKNGFDNRGFRIESGRELEPIGHYRVFVKEIPSEYHVAEVVVGFNSGGRLIWEHNFRVATVMRSG